MTRNDEQIQDIVWELFVKWAEPNGCYEPIGDGPPSEEDWGPHFDCWIDGFANGYSLKSLGIHVSMED